MENIVRTGVGAALQTAQLFGLQHTILPHTTLNEKFNIQASALLSETDRTVCKYLCIGNGGHRTAIGDNNIAKIVPVQHRPSNTALYNHLPFVLRPVAADLTPPERSLYRLRRLEEHDGMVYAAYYLKVLDLTNTKPSIELRSVEDGVTTSQPWIPSIADLNPIPPPINDNGVLVTSGDYLAATAKVPFTMSAEDIEEFLNVANVLYGDPGYAMISEIALCSGTDKVVSGEFNGNIAAYTDAICVQAISYMSTFIPALFNNAGVDITFDVGSVEPLLLLQTP